MGKSQIEANNGNSSRNIRVTFVKVWWYGVNVYWPREKNKNNNKSCEVRNKEKMGIKGIK